ncbi:MAG: inorganic phosphate transporter [Actinomycetota bacterium]
MPVWLVVAFALLFEFANGWTDAPNAIATVVSTRVLRPYHAVAMAAVLNLAGALAVGTAVAETIAAGIVDPQFIGGDVGLNVVAAAVLAAAFWAMGAQVFGMPSSETHALVASLLGAGFAAGGLDALEWSGTSKVVYSLFTSPPVAFLSGFLLMVVIYRVFRRARPRTVRRTFGRGQIVSAAFMAFSHGANDAQKAMGVITLALFLGGYLPDLNVPLWVIFAAALTMAAGTSVGGWRVIRTIGLKMTKLEPVNGFAAETAAAAIISGAARFGIPLSTTHVIGSSIMGVGATRRLSAVRWGVAGQVVGTWVLTWPGCMLLGYLLGRIFLAVV